MEYFIGVMIYFFARCILSGFYTVDQNERAVKTIFGRAQRIEGQRTSQHPMSTHLTGDEGKRYDFPMVQAIGPGLHFKLPWEQVYKVSIATETMNMAFDPESPRANRNGTVLDAVTRDQLNIGLTGQIRYRISESNLYAFLFGIKTPITHVMGYFVSVLREKIANYESNKATGKENAMSIGDTHISETISINDLRKNLRDINDMMIQDCRGSEARYGIILDASLITGIDPPPEVDSALAAINTAYNNVSSEISLAKASADQTIVLSKRAVEIEMLKVQAEVEPLNAMAGQLRALKSMGTEVLPNFVRNVKMGLFKKAKKVILSK